MEPNQATAFPCCGIGRREVSNGLMTQSHETYFKGRRKQRSAEVERSFLTLRFYVIMVSVKGPPAVGEVKYGMGRVGE